MVYHENTLKKDRSYKLGTTIWFDERDTARNYLVSGFSKNEGNFTWTDGHDAELRFELEQVSDSLTIRLGHGIRGPKQQVDVWVNDRFAGTYTAETNDTTVYRMHVPSGIVTGKELRIRLHLPDASAPADTNATDSDARLLGLSMVSLAIDKR